MGHLWRESPPRGLRQGDPISPYLFILCTEVLSGLCKNAQSQGKLRGLQVSQKSPYVNHLLFADDTMLFCKTNVRNCRELSSILRRYEQSSGQSINLDKSTVTFSGKTPDSVKDRVKNVLGILKEGGMGKYLGLPESFGRSKRDVFTGVVDKIRQRAHSWTTKFLSGAGKHVMLQSVLTALLTFSMSSFKIPISLCRRIQSILTRFWWDSAPDKRKISWVAWSIMAQPKCRGGLGFKNIEEYNDSLLGKLSWRILSNPNSLLSRILKGKYFPDCDFMESRDKTGSSHGWTGIMAGKAVLEKGLGFLVGEGKNIRVWSDQWLSPLRPLAPIAPPTLANKDLLVADLLDHQTNEWDLAKIRLHLPQYEDLIRLIIPGNSKPMDKLVWLPDPSGVYSTKSGYKKICEVEEPPPPEAFDLIKNVWKLRTSPKIQLFLWRMLNNALPVGSLLAIRGIQTELSCKRYGAQESIEHLFTNCPFAAEFWTKAPLMSTPGITTEMVSLKNWLSINASMRALPPVGVADTVLVPWLLWNLWKARNGLVFEGKSVQVEDIITKAVAEARAWEAANVLTSTKEKKTPRSRPPLTVPVCWTDGAWREPSKLGGMGWIIKSREGEVICRGSSNRTHVGSALMAEALAVREALRKAKELNLQSLQIFSDSQVLVSALCQGLDLNEIAGVQQDIKSLATLFCPLSFSVISRLENSQADSLAKSGLDRLMLA